VDEQISRFLGERVEETMNDPGLEFDRFESGDEMVAAGIGGGERYVTPLFGQAAVDGGVDLALGDAGPVEAVGKRGEAGFGAVEVEELEGLALACWGGSFHETETEGSRSFLKKRTKKLLLMASSGRLKLAKLVPPVTDKSFLVLFFKKELLPCFS
jgi:hypothetical protein